MPGVNYKVALGIALASGLAFEGIYYFLEWYKRKRKERLSDRIFHDVIFFPDQQVACNNYFNTEDGCQNTNCRYTHEKTSLSELHRHLRSARQSVDVCVFTITCPELGDAIVNLCRTGLVVRVIVDSEMSDASGSQIGKFRKEGIQVRPGRSSYFMHHKFVILDNKTLINGSFNWTKQAITGNNENLLITNDSKIVKMYMQEFSKLWAMYDPVLLHAGDHPR